MSKTTYTAALVAVTLVMAMPAAFAYETVSSLDQYVTQAQLASDAVKIASENKGAGSGTPYLAADGVVGASAITVAVFGALSAMFFLRARHGRYAAPGRG